MSAAVVLVHRHGVRPENLAFHDLGKAEDGVERRAQLVAHLGEEPRFRDVGGFGAAARLVRDGFRLFELADERVLLGAGLERRQRRRVEAVREQRKVPFGRQRHDGEDVIVQRAFDGEIERDRDGDRQRQREHRDRQARRQHARYRHHQQHHEQHEGGGLIVDADRIDQDERPRHAEEQIEHDEAHPPRAQLRGRGRLVEKLPASANDDEMDEKRAAGPHAGRHRPGPKPGKRPDGDDQEQDDRRGRNAVLRELAQQFVIEDRPRAAGRGEPVARLAHVLGRAPPLGRRCGGRRGELVRFADCVGHRGPGLALYFVAA